MGVGTRELQRNFVHGWIRRVVIIAKIAGGGGVFRKDLEEISQSALGYHCASSARRYIAFQA